MSSVASRSSGLFARPSLRPAEGTELAVLRQFDAQFRQQACEPVALAASQPAAAAPPVKQSLLALGARLRQYRPQAKAARRRGARSMRSQEKPPSGSGGRPKWP